MFLPLQFGQEDVFVNNLVKKMDENSDGKIGFDAFVHGIKTSGDWNTRIFVSRRHFAKTQLHFILKM